MGLGGVLGRLRCVLEALWRTAKKYKKTKGFIAFLGTWALLKTCSERLVGVLGRLGVVLEPTRTAKHAKYQKPFRRARVGRKGGPQGAPPGETNDTPPLPPPKRGCPRRGRGGFPPPQ